MADVTLRINGEDLYAIYDETARVLEAKGFYISLYDPDTDLARVVFYADKGDVSRCDVTHRGSDSNVVRRLSHNAGAKSGFDNPVMISVGDEDETSAYIRHRLRHVGGSGEEFTPDAVRRIFEETDGIPRLINKVCDLALVYSASAGKTRVETGIIDEIFEDGLILKPAAPPHFLTNRIDLPRKAAE